MRWIGASKRLALIGAGPVEMADEVRETMARSSRIYFGRVFDQELMEPLVHRLRAVFATREGLILPVPGSARTALVASLTTAVAPGEKIVVISTGHFGDLMVKMCEKAGMQVLPYEVPLGQPCDLEGLQTLVRTERPAAIAMVHNETSTGSIYPVKPVGELAREVDALLLVDTVSSLTGVEVETDGWNIDINITGSQKCLGGPVGLGIACIGPRAWERMNARAGARGSWGYDLCQWRDEYVSESMGGKVPIGSSRLTPIGISTQVLDAVTMAVDLVLKEGLKRRFFRHRIAGAAFRAGIEAYGLELFAAPEVRSATVTSVRMPADCDATRIWQQMRECFGYEISRTPAPLSDCLRFGTMGIAATPGYVLSMLSSLEIILRRQGAMVPAGEGVRAAQQVFLDADAEAESLGL